MPPVFNPDTVLWEATDYLGNVLGQGDFVFTEGNPVFSDSVCAPLPLSCYTLHLNSSDVLWGATYLEVDASMGAFNFNNVWMNVANPDLTLDFVLDETVCTIDVSERGHSKLAIYPIPAHDMLHLSSDQLGEWMILDRDGRLIMRSKPGQTGNQNIDISQMSSGIYHLRWISEHAVEVISFVKE
jgi:Secretion system C-terminal sorting domain